MQHNRRSLLDPYKDYLLQRWNDGCREVLQLFGEIKARGYPGSYDTVARYARRLVVSQKFLYPLQTGDYQQNFRF